MEFASSHVFNYDESDEEEITERDLDLSGHAASNYTTLKTDVNPPEPLYDNVLLNTGPQHRPAAAAEVIYDNAIPKARVRDLDSGLYASPYDIPKQRPYQYIRPGEIGASPSDQQPPPLPPMRKPKKKVDSAHKCRQADTNVIAVKFDTLASPTSVHPSPAVFCGQCQAAFSTLNSVMVGPNGEQVWKCAFCDRMNQSGIDAALTAIPKEDDVTYTVHPGSGQGDDTAVIFMVDISGSMCVTTEVPGNVVGEQRLNDAGAALSAYREETQDRYSAGPQKQDVCYVSRLQAMQSAIDQQLSKMERNHGNKRVGIIAFNDSVTVIGDGSEEPVPLEGAGLTDQQSIISLGRNFPLPDHIREVRRCLADKIFSLTEGGQTALGPALLLSVAVASQKPGSKVIVCTDGMANIGLGKLDGVDDEHYEKASKFYETVGHYARDSGTCVSVLAMEGEDCRVIELGNVADTTGGQVNIVNPLRLTEEFANILDDPILATNVSAKLVLHQGMYFRGDSTDCSNQASQATRNMGIVTRDSETTFEFGVRTKPQREVLYDNFGGMTVTHKDDQVKVEHVYDSTPTSMIAGLETLPFQLQIWYMARDGSKNVRIITMNRPITKDRHFAEQNANVAVLGAHAAQSAAKLAVDGLYGEARINALVTQKLVERHAQHQGDEGNDVYQTFVSTLAPIQSELYRAHTLARRSTGPPADELDDDTSEYAFFLGEKSSNNKSRLTKKAKKRRKKITDKQANLFYKMKNATSKMFQKNTFQVTAGSIND